MDKAVYEKNLLARVVACIEKYGGKDCLTSIILTGSFGRGEPTYAVDLNGELQLKSDVEIALVFPKIFQKRTVEKLIRCVSSEFVEDLNLMAISEKRVKKVYNFNFTLQIPRYKTIFTYDLFNGSRTIWGTDFIGMKKIMLSDVDLYEAKRMVANRIGELVYLQNIANVGEKDFLRIQWKGKLVLAMVSAWLICEGDYVSSYQGQYDKVNMAVNKIESSLGKGFFYEYKRVFFFLRENGEQYEVPDKVMRSYVKNIDLYFHKNKIGVSRVNSFGRNMKYAFKYMKSGVKRGLCHFENKILQALIVDYWSQSDCLKEDAEIWHRVLY